MNDGEKHLLFVSFAARGEDDEEGGGRHNLELNFKEKVQNHGVTLGNITNRSIMMTKASPKFLQFDITKFFGSSLFWAILTSE